MSDAKSVSEKYIARYHIMEELASSSSSRIFLAKHNVSIPLPIVIKLFYSVRVDTLQEEAYFLEEIRLHRQLQHPFILPVMDSGVDKRTPYIAMAYLPSGSLYDRMLHTPVKPFSIENILVILSQIGQALHHAHQHNIFHGNLKPRNILLHEDGYVQLTDFTFTTLRYNANPDSTLYMAPEQLTDRTTALSDQYALGCLAYELFTSRAFFRSSFPDQQQRAAVAPPTLYNPLLPLHIEQAILKAISLKPAQRYPTIPAFLNALTNSTPMATVAPSLLSSIPTHNSDQNISSSAYLHDNVAEEGLLTLTTEPEPADHLSEEDTLELLFQENEEQSSLPLVGTTISKQTTIPQTPILLINNDAITVTPSPKPKKPVRWKSLFLLISGIIIFLLLGNLIASTQFLTYTTKGSIAHATTTTAVKPDATSVTTQSPTLSSTASDHTRKATPTSTKPSAASSAATVGGTLPQASTPITTFTPPANPPSPPTLATSNQLQINPTRFNNANCVPDNSNYRCTAVLKLSNQFHGQLSWQASSTGFAAKFSTSNGNLVAGQTMQSIVYIPAICPNNGTLNFSGAGITATATWNC